MSMKTEVDALDGRGRGNRWPLVLGAALLLNAGGCATQPAATPGVTRTYYIAADEVDWDYAPGNQDVTMGKPLGAKEYPLFGHPGVEARVFRKAVYREYTDSTFTQLEERPPQWQHLGILGPVLRGAVGDSIIVVFKNNGRFPYSVHPHGVFYDKGSEGALYNDGTSAADKHDDGVPPGEVHRYAWAIPERAGPGPDDPSSIMWPYHSHHEELQDVHSGLVGAIIVTRRGEADASGKPRDVDREFVTLFASFNENTTHYTRENLKRYKGDTVWTAQNPPFRVNGYQSINGLMYGTLPLASLTVHEGDRVRWYVFSSTGFDDFHTPHWHGGTVLVLKHRTDVIDLGGPLLSVVADMVADDPGIWLYHCHFADHMKAGMSARYQILPAAPAEDTTAAQSQSQ
jgi:FtsP/CotA-like multicopper oxidase with cupredoxin domain